jgi:hypothetical protein
MLDVQHRPDIGGAVACEALVSPAKRVRAKDHVVELENRIVRVRRLLFKHIEPSPGDSALLQNLGLRICAPSLSGVGIWMKCS